MPTGLGYELTQYGKAADLGSALSELGDRIRQERLRTEANKQLQGLTGIDMSKPGALDEIRRAILNLGQLGPEGQQGISTVEKAQNVGTSALTDKQKLFTSETALTAEQIEDYSKNMGDRTKEENLIRHDTVWKAALAAEQKYPEFAGQLTNTIPEPSGMSQKRVAEVELDRARIQSYADRAQLERDKLELDKGKLNFENMLKQSYSAKSYQTIVSEKERIVQKYDSLIDIAKRGMNITNPYEDPASFKAWKDSFDRLTADRAQVEAEAEDYSGKARQLDRVPGPTPASAPSPTGKKPLKW